MTTVSTLRRSEAGSSPSLSSLASPSVPDAPAPDVAPTRRAEAVVVAPVAALLLPPPSQARNVAHLFLVGMFYFFHQVQEYGAGFGTAFINK